MKKLLLAMSIVVGVSANANAELISSLDSEGNKVVTDTSTGIDWMSFSDYFGYSMNQVSALISDGTLSLAGNWQVRIWLRCY